MAPRTTAQRRSQAQNEHIYDLGVRGRKTGVILKDSGLRDEYGMQPLGDDLFSSPEKENRRVIEEDSEEDDEEEMEMDIDETTGPAPSAFMNARNGVQLPIPRGRSPPKTFLQSPAIKNPTLGPSSSPARGSVVHPRGHSSSQPVTRKLDFGMQTLSAAKPTTNGTNRLVAKPNGLTNGHRQSQQEEEEEEEEEEEDEDESDDASLPPNDDDSMAIIDAGVDDYIDDNAQDEPVEELEVSEEEEEAELAPKAAAAGRKGRPKKTVVQDDEDQEPEPEVEQELTPDESDEPVKAGRKRGRPAKVQEAQEDDVAEKPSKRRRSAQNPSPGEESEAVGAKEAKKGLGRKAGRLKATDSAAEAESSKASKAAKKADGKGKAKGGRKRGSSEVGEASFVEPPRGPPPPKSRGLMIMRRETPGAAPGIFQTRSGRTSYKPLAFWKNEHVEHDGGDILEDGKAHILMPKIKEIVRIEDAEDDRPVKRKGRGARTTGKKSKRRYSDEESEDENVEPWEEDPGVVTGEVIMWDPVHEFNPPALDEEVEVAEEQIAIAGSAIETRDIRNAKFRFAKTLSMPFFGSGIVDMPPGAVKRPKNSRKMHMTFFVHTGRVKVTVGETAFGIGKGGMWFVPRGNYYSIENEGDQPSRIFFSQGCEVNAGSGAQAEQSMLG